MRYTTRPLSDRTWLRETSTRMQSRFDSTWSSTLSLLGREIDHLDGRDVVIECDIREQDIRNDGMIRANARPATPAVVVAFDTKQHGPMLYRCDRYVTGWRGESSESWQHNVRAIALTLESLRAVDRYGATETGQQYAGFKALPAGRALPASHMTRTAAAELLERIAIGDEGEQRERTVERLLTSPELLRQVLREAKAMTHPDRRGDREMWDQVEQAAIVLGVAS